MRFARTFGRVGVCACVCVQRIRNLTMSVSVHMNMNGVKNKSGSSEWTTSSMILPPLGAFSFIISSSLCASNHKNTHTRAHTDMLVPLATCELRHSAGAYICAMYVLLIATFWHGGQEETPIWCARVQRAVVEPDEPTKNARAERERNDDMLWINQRFITAISWFMRHCQMARNACEYRAELYSRLIPLSGTSFSPFRLLFVGNSLGVTCDTGTMCTH